METPSPAHQEGPTPAAQVPLTQGPDSPVCTLQSKRTDRLPGVLLVIVSDIRKHTRLDLRHLHSAHGPLLSAEVPTLVTSSCPLHSPSWRTPTMPKCLCVMGPLGPAPSRRGDARPARCPQQGGVGTGAGLSGVQVCAIWSLVMWRGHILKEKRLWSARSPLSRPAAPALLSGSYDG